MKKFLAILLASLTLLSFTACSSENNKKDEETKKESTKTEESTDTLPITEKAETDSYMMDFSAISVENYFFAYCNKKTFVPDDIKDADVYCSSKITVATVSPTGEITPKKSGTTLIGYEKDGVQKAIICCVFGEGEEPSKVASSPQVFEKGQTFLHIPPVGEAQYISSNDSVVNVENAPNLSFDDCGYAVICVQNISRPFYYSFIVYDRIVDH